MSEFDSGAPARFTHDIIALRDGYIHDVHPREIGLALVDVGAGRKVSTDKIDHSAGVTYLKQSGAQVTKGETLARLQWSSDQTDSTSAIERITKAFEIQPEAAPTRPLTYFTID